MKRNICIYLYLKEYSDEESEKCKDVIVGGEDIGHTHNDHCPFTEEKNRFATELVRQSCADDRTEHHAHYEYCLCEVLEICTIAHQVPLQQYLSLIHI